MGNGLTLPCACQEAGVAPPASTSGAKKSSRSSRRKWPAPRHAVVPVDAGEEEEFKRAWPGCRVEPAGDDGMRVKVVMRRKDAAELVARLGERGAAERKARMGELNGELAAGTASPCRDLAWRPRLAGIPEN